PLGSVGGRNGRGQQGQDEGGGDVQPAHDEPPLGVVRDTVKPAVGTGLILYGRARCVRLLARRASERGKSPSLARRANRSVTSGGRRPRALQSLRYETRQRNQS